MEFYVLDQNFQTIFILDRYESIIWVDRYNEVGTFELYTPVTDDIMTYVRPDNYLMNPNSRKLMIIEDFAIESNIEDGNRIKVIGRSLESILDRRVIWKQTNIDGNLQTAVKKLINENIISPTTATGGTDRKINNFVFNDSDDERVTALKLTNQYFGENLLDVIVDICDTNKLGFEVILNSSHQFVFSLYFGEDRSYKQNELPYVTFSPLFDNVISSNYAEEHSSYKNIALVGGEGEGSKKKTRVVGTSTGIFRKEIYVEASNISKDDSGTAKKYVQALDEYGKKELANNKVKRDFDAKCSVNQGFILGEDYNIGDIVQFANEYGIEAPARIKEYTWSYNTEGVDLYPTFESVNDGINLHTDSSDVSDDEFYDYLEQVKQLKTNGTTTFTFTTDKIQDLSLVTISCSIWGFVPTDVTLGDPNSSGERVLTVVFPKYKTAQNLTVRVYIR
jgi:hypothetical protein